MRTRRGPQRVRLRPEPSLPPARRASQPGRWTPGESRAEPRTAASGLGSAQMVAQRDREGKNALVGELGVLCWLLKDAFWVVLCPYVCIPAALSAISIETYYLFQSWPTLGRQQQMHTLAVLLWLLGNFTWMCGELLFAPSEGAGRHFPWFHGPLVAASEEINGYFVAVARVIFTTGILTCASCYPRYVRISYHIILCYIMLYHGIEYSIVHNIVCYSMSHYTVLYCVIVCS